MSSARSVNGLPDIQKIVSSVVDRFTAERREEKRRAALLRAIAEQRIRFTRAMDLRAECVVYKGGDLQTLSQELAREHELLRRAVYFAKAIQNKCAGDEGTYLAACDLAQNEGGFLESHAQDIFEERLRWTASDHPRWMIARSRGRPIDVKDQTFATDVVGGGIQVELPTPEQPDAVMDLLPRAECGDSMPSTQKTNRILAEIQDNPLRAAAVRDIYALHPHLGFASAARDTTFQEIIALNEKRDIQERIRYILAGIFSIRGLFIPDQEPLVPPDEEWIENIISLRVHTKSDKYPSELGWLLRGENSPPQSGDNRKRRNVSVPEIGAGVELITDWNVVVTDLEETQRRRQLRADYDRLKRSARDTEAEGAER